MITNHNTDICVDAHLHARQPGTNGIFEAVVPTYVRNSAGLYMMNFPTPLDLGDTRAALAECWRYWDEIKKIAAVVNPNHKAILMPVMADKWTPKQLDDFIKSAKGAGLPLAGFKLFPRGQSTNSDDAPTFENAVKLMDVVEDNGLVVAIHGESLVEPNASHKEEKFVEHILPHLLVREDGTPRNPKKISFEHITTILALRFAKEAGIYYSITPHHTVFFQEMFGIANTFEAEKILREKYPHFFCKPIVQTALNALAMRKEWICGNSSRLIIGTDNAPHLEANKIAPDASKRFAGMYWGDTVEGYTTALYPDLGPERVLENIRKYSKNACNLYSHVLDYDKLSPRVPAPMSEEKSDIVKSVADMKVPMSCDDEVFATAAMAAARNMLLEINR
ncbi:MAG: hypothetical protein FWD15_01475 [Alphaproteobacteria bacterium]|nr:hypothetical protein [Alphaproteobacteria bacterium]